MKQYYTTIDQSNVLLKIGIDPLTADMFYAIDDCGEYKTYLGSYADLPFEPNEKSKEKFLPCWTLGSLTDAILKNTCYGSIRSIVIENSKDGECICKIITAYNGSYIFIALDQIDSIIGSFYELRKAKLGINKYDAPETL